MRITNKIIQRNNLSNINTNKLYQDKLSTQMSTQKKISRPSEDPVVAIRALRLRSNVTEITQYYSKNIPDAESWINVTEAALDNLAQIITNMKTRCTTGANGDLTTANRKIILEELKGLGEEVYATGDADYAGRYIFTGYRTDTSLSFLKEDNTHYSLTEQLDKNAIDSVITVNTDKLLDINSTNFDDAADGIANITDKDITSTECYRMRLAYNDCQVYAAGDTALKIEFTAADGTPTTWTLGTEIEQIRAADDPYNQVKDDSIIYVPETGELLLGKDRYEELMATRDDDHTQDNEAEIRITYDKSSWQKGDLRPEHYFACQTYKTLDDGTEAVDVEYNQNYLTTGAERQVIEYDVGFNQTLRINSTADECFQHGIGREVDDIVNAMQDVLDLEEVKAAIEGIMEEITGKAAGEGDNAAVSATQKGQLEILQRQLDAVDKALTYAKDKEQRLFEKGISSFQKYLDDANLCVTNNGTRGSKLALIKSRMQNQKTTFDTLKSENEDVDITEVAINLNSAELTYDAALMATGKVMQSTLLNYI